MLINIKQIEWVSPSDNPTESDESLCGVRVATAGASRRVLRCAASESGRRWTMMCSLPLLILPLPFFHSRLGCVVYRSSCPVPPITGEHKGKAGDILRKGILRGASSSTGPARPLISFQHSCQESQNWIIPAPSFHHYAYSTFAYLRGMPLGVRPAWCPQGDRNIHRSRNGNSKMELGWRIPGWQRRCFPLVNTRRKKRENRFCKVCALLESCRGAHEWMIGDRSLAPGGCYADGEMMAHLGRSLYVTNARPDEI